MRLCESTRGRRSSIVESRESVQCETLLPRVELAEDAIANIKAGEKVPKADEGAQTAKDP